VCGVLRAFGKRGVIHVVALEAPEHQATSSSVSSNQRHRLIRGQCCGDRSMKSSKMIFISYRRDDVGGEAGRLNDTLNQLLGPDSTFFDFEQITPGTDFKVELQRALHASRVFLALIGPRWETLTDSSGKPRLGDKNDLVRLELQTALKSKKVRVVPILLNRDTVPNRSGLPYVLRPVTALNAFAIRRDRWRDDVAALLKRLGLFPDTARLVSASVEWKRKNEPDSTPRRWVVYIDNDSDAPITVEQVKVSSPSMELEIQDWGTVRSKVQSDYELEESDFDPSGDRPVVYVRFLDASGQKWTLRRGTLKRIGATR
jgi:hypothetical protein